CTSLRMKPGWRSTRWTRRLKRSSKSISWPLAMGMRLVTTIMVRLLPRSGPWYRAPRLRHPRCDDEATADTPGTAPGDPPLARRERRRRRGAAAGDRRQGGRAARQPLAPLVLAERQPAPPHGAVRRRRGRAARHPQLRHRGRRLRHRTALRARPPRGLPGGDLLLARRARRADGRGHRLRRLDAPAARRDRHPAAPGGVLPRPRRERALGRRA